MLVQSGRAVFLLTYLCRMWGIQWKRSGCLDARKHPTNDL